LQPGLNWELENVEMVACRKLTYVIEDPSEEGMTVLLPAVICSFLRAGKIIISDRVEVLKAKLADFTWVPSQWGVGLEDILGKE
jgi:hypothetical protein